MSESWNWRTTTKSVLYRLCYVFHHSVFINQVTVRCQCEKMNWTADILMTHCMSDSCPRLVVWRLWSIQLEWDVLPTRAKLQPLQRHQMVLLERFGLLTEGHCHDDETSRLLRFPLSHHAQKKHEGKETDNQQRPIPKPKQQMDPKHFNIVFLQHYKHSRG